MNVVSDEIKIIQVISDGMLFFFFFFGFVLLQFSRWKLKGLQLNWEHFQQCTFALCKLEHIR